VAFKLTNEHMGMLAAFIFVVAIIALAGVAPASL
jgi:hypothetical protein